MKLPIIINESGNLYFYDAIEKAELELEAIDVSNNEYIAYDASGKLLSLKIVNEEHESVFGKGYVDIVKIIESDNYLDESDKLRKILIKNFKDEDIYSSNDETCNFEMVLNKAISLYGYS